MKTNVPACKLFNGYKPCYLKFNCWENDCREMQPLGKKILIINLDAMGDVVMTTAQLAGLKEAYPESSIFWVTLKSAAPLLFNNPLILQVFPYDFETVQILQQMKFDIILSCDKSQRACALASALQCDDKRGFGLDENGKIYPFNAGAFYNFRLGLDDHLKFKVNQRTGQDYLAETFEIPYQRNEYILQLTAHEELFIERYKSSMGLSESHEVIGLNTGCSNLFPNKKLTVLQHIELIGKLLAQNRFQIMLLGGPEDTERNEQIAAAFEGKVINTPTTEGIRTGACYMAIPDLVITGDSFGMHLAIAFKKYVIAWFGLSCWTEIDLYDRGVKLFPADLECAPCWNRTCPNNLECIQAVDLDRIVTEAVSYFDSMKK